ncbi:hypothetical protein ACQP00_27895 [Dactylosporangium sp. CS-047395]|uniref:hypothetical protein n=1 Tax=Dactylosporangium sp. CS-047395 TaxID=3239936 RepID=UPI003D91A4B1
MARVKVSFQARPVTVARGPALLSGLPVASALGTATAAVAGDAHGGDAVAPVLAGLGSGRARFGDGAGCLMARVRVPSVARPVFVARGLAALPGSAVAGAHGGDAVAPCPPGSAVADALGLTMAAVT